MIRHVKDFDNHKYEVHEGKIGYPKNDIIDTGQFRGYSTMFAYFYRYESGDVKELDLVQNVGIIIECGEYSYAEIPAKFRLVLGLSGTLGTLTEMPEQNVRKGKKTLSEKEK